MSEDAMLEREAKRLGVTVTELKMREAVPDNVVRDIVNDGRKGISQSTSMLVPEHHKRAERSEPLRRGNDEPRQLQQPPGISLIDAMCDVADARDRAKR